MLTMTARREREDQPRGNASTGTLTALAECGWINRRFGYAVVEIDGQPQRLPWGRPVSLDITPGQHTFSSYLVLLDTDPRCASIANRTKTVTAEFVPGERIGMRYRPSRLFSSSYRGRIRLDTARSGQTNGPGPIPLQARPSRAVPSGRTCPLSYLAACH